MVAHIPATDAAATIMQWILQQNWEKGRRIPTLEFRGALSSQPNSLSKKDVNPALYLLQEEGLLAKIDEKSWRLVGLPSKAAAAASSTSLPESEERMAVESTAASHTTATDAVAKKAVDSEELAQERIAMESTAGGHAMATDTSKQKAKKAVAKKAVDSEELAQERIAMESTAGGHAMATDTSKQKAKKAVAKKAVDSEELAQERIAVERVPQRKSKGQVRGLEILRWIVDQIHYHEKLKAALIEAGVPDRQDMIMMRNFGFCIILAERHEVIDASEAAHYRRVNEQANSAKHMQKAEDPYAA